MTTPHAPDDVPADGFEDAAEANSPTETTAPSDDAAQPTHAREFSDEDLEAAANWTELDLAHELGDAPGEATPGADGPTARTSNPLGPSGRGPGPETPGPQTTTYRRLYRSRTDRKIAGVAGGLARYLGIDPTLVRIAFVVLTVTGVSVLAYVAAWLLVPEHPHDRTEPLWQSPNGTDRNTALAVGLGSFGIAVAMLSSSWTLVAVVLIVGGIWLLTEQPHRHEASVLDVAQEGQHQARAPQSGASRTPPPPGAGYVPLVPPQTGSRRRRPQRITRAVLSALALLTGLAIAAETGGWWEVNPTRMLAIGIVIIGAGVLLGAITDLGARWLIPLGLLGLLVLGPVSIVDAAIDDGVGEVTFRPTTLVELDESYHHGVGEMVVDLRGLDLDGERRNLEIDLGIGELTVLVDDDLGGTARLEASAGELNIDLVGDGLDRTFDGVTIESGTIELPGDRGELDLDIEVGLGVIYLRGE